MQNSREDCRDDLNLLPSPFIDSDSVVFIGFCEKSEHCDFTIRGKGHSQDLW